MLIAIQTDGQENASVEYKQADLVALVKEKTAEGWTFVFLGAGIDSFAVARAMGIPVAGTMTYDRNKSGAAFSAATRSAVVYASSGVSLDAAFTSEERLSTGGHMPTDPQQAAQGTPVPQPATTSASKPKTKIVDDIKL